MQYVIWAFIAIPVVVLVGSFLEGVFCLITGKEPFFSDTTYHSD